MVACVVAWFEALTALAWRAVSGLLAGTPLTDGLSGPTEWLASAAADSTAGFFSKNTTSASRRLLNRCQRSATCSACGAPSVTPLIPFASPVSADDFDSRMGPQPFCDGFCTSAVQHIHALSGFQVDQDRPRLLPFPFRPVLKPQHSRRPHSRFSTVSDGPDH